MVTGTPDALPFIIGHRGASRDAPENTLESFRLAWKQGANGIEADFRLTADGHIVCMHDANTRRTTGIDLVVASSTFEELRRLDAGSWKGSAWAGAVIPSLPEVLAEIPDKSWFFIEIKCGAEIIPHLADVLQRSKISPQRVRFLVFNAQLVKELKQQLPEWRTCWNCDYRYSMSGNVWHPSKEEIIATLISSGADGLSSANRAILDTDLVETVKGLNKEIHVWTVDRLRAAQRLSALGVDSIMTNRTAWLRSKLTQNEAIS